MESSSSHERRRASMRVFVTIGLSLLLWGLVLPSEALVDRVVAVVNQEIITLSEVERWMKPYLQAIDAEDRLERREQVNEVCRKILDQLIEEKLIDQEVKRSGIKVSSKEIEAAVEEIKRRHGATQEDLEKVLAREGLTLEVFKKQIEKRLLRMKLVNWAVKVEPKDREKELKEFYEKNIDQYQTEISYRPAHILFAVPKEAAPKEVQEIRKRCQKVWERIKEGANFGEMALLYSEDASSKDRGDLGYFKRGELVPAFEKEALRLQVGEVGQIVRTDFGFHIIKLLDRKGGVPLSFEMVKEKVKSDYQERETERAFKEFLSKLREKSVIEIKL
jgi:peptidyl-prolyl cis-trans isomerase SurA